MTTNHDSVTAIRRAMVALARDPGTTPTAKRLAAAAGIGRATLYRAFRVHPDLAAEWARLTSVADPATKQRQLAEVNVHLADARREVRELRGLVDAPAATIVALDGENRRLRNTAEPSTVTSWKA